MTLVSQFMFLMMIKYHFPSLGNWGNPVGPAPLGTLVCHCGLFEWPSGIRSCGDQNTGFVLLCGYQFLF